MAAGLADDMICLVAEFLPLAGVACMLRTCHVWKHALGKLPRLQFSNTYSDLEHRIWTHTLARHIASIDMQLYGTRERGIDTMRHVCHHMPWITSHSD
jgi:hypothetical protein